MRTSRPAYALNDAFNHGNLFSGDLHLGRNLSNLVCSKVSFAIQILMLVISGFLHKGVAQTISFSPTPTAGVVYLCEGGQVVVTINGTVPGEVYNLNANPPDGTQTMTATGTSVTFLPIVYNPAGSYSISIIRSAPTLLFFPNQNVSVVVDPTAPVPTLSHPEGLVPAGTLISATAGTAGSGGVAGCIDGYEYSIDGGITWLPYTLGDNINTTVYLMTEVKIKSYREHPDGLACYAENIYTWMIDSRVHDITGTQGSYYDIQQAIDAASTMDGDVLEIESVTMAINSVVNINKEITLRGQGIATTVLELSSSWFNVNGVNAFSLNDQNITIEDIHFKIVGKGQGNILALFQSNCTIQNNKFSGEYEYGDGQVTRAAVWSANNMTGLTFDDNIIESLRQPGYLSNGSGTIHNNSITTTRGWVIEGVGNMSFMGNTFGANTSHITILSNATNLSGLTIENNDFSGDVVDWKIDNRAAGVADADCNWFGTTSYSTIYNGITGKVSFVPYRSSNGGLCNQGFAMPDNLALTHTPTIEDILVVFDVTDNDLELRPIPGLDPNIPAQLAQIVALYNALAVAIAGGDPVQIQQAALAVGDDVITEYFYLDGMTKIYLQTAGNNDLVKNKYWQEYLVRSSDTERFPDWLNNMTQINQAEFRTHTNPGTGSVSAGWLNPVLGRDLHVKVTFIHNGSVASIEEIVPIPAGPIQNLNTGYGYPTIQEAVDDAGSNHRIGIATGSYTGSVDGTGKTIALVPGNSPGCVTITGDFTLTAMNTLEMEVNGLVACTNYDQFIINGVVTLGGADLDLTLSYVPSLGDAYNLISNDGVDPVVGQFAQGLSISQGGHVFHINYAGGDGNDVVLTKCTGGIVNTNTAKEFCSLQDAIDDASTLDNHTISVAAGVYTLSSTVNVHKSLIINGPQVNIDPRTTAGIRTPGNMAEAIFDGGGILTTLFNITANTVVMNGLEVRNGTGDLITSTDDYPATSRDIRIKYCIVNNSNGPGDEGIQLFNLDGGGVEYCRVFNVAQDGINLAEGCTNSYISNNEIYQSGSSNGAVYLYDNRAYNSITDNVIYSNTAPHGITIGRLDGTNFNSNSAETNNAVVSGNDITGNGNSNNVGIYVNTSRVDVIDNEVSNCGSTVDAALYFRYNIKEITVTGNDCHDNENGIKISSGVSATNVLTFIVQNNSFDNTNDKTIKNGSAGTLAATCNWLGSTDFGTNNSKITGAVTFLPWLSTGVDAQPATIGFQPAASCGNNVTIDSASPEHITCGPTIGSIEVVFSNGVAPYDIVWTGGSASGITSPYIITPLLAGTYDITVTSANGTTANSSSTILYLPVTNSSDVPDTYYATIQQAINAADPGETIEVCPGLYNEDVLVNKAGLTVTGDQASNTSVSGPIGGDGATFRVSAAGVIIENFTITRDGNNTTDWNNPGLNFAGVAMQGQTVNATIRYNIITGNRTGIDINNSNGNTILDNEIDFNRTGMILRNQTDNTIMTGNYVRDNWTAGILFLDASGGTNSPQQSAINSNFNNNNISGNWYGDIVDRQSGGSLPSPGSNIKNFECNWYGVTSPSVTTANSMEPGYAAQIPVAYGGAATNPGGAPNILGPASANFDYIPWGVNGADNAAAFGWQITPGTCTGTPVVINAVSVTDKLYCVNGSLEVDFSGGTAPYDINWTGGSAMNISSPYTITNLSDGMYGITITDTNGSTAITSATIDNLPVRNLALPAHYATIQEAINAALPGNTIEICDGTYNERLTIDKSLSLLGQSENNTILEGIGLAGTGSGIYINAGVTNVSIETMTIQNFAGINGNASGGIYANGGNNNLSVENVTIQNNVGSSGFYANGPVDNVTLNAVTSSGHTIGARGIVIWNGLKSNITITNCEVFNNNCCGIELQDGSATGVTIENNNVHDNGDNGIGVVGLTGPVANVVSDNVLMNNGRFGIEIKNPDGNGLNSGAGSILVDNNMVSRNVAIVDVRDIAGIAVMRRGVLGANPDIPIGVYVSNNTVTGYVQPTTSEGFGIVVAGINHTVTGNTLNGNDVGIQQQAGHTPYPGDGDQNNLADQFFGRDNTPYSCANVFSSNTYSSNGTDYRDVGTIGADGYVLNENTGRTFCSIQSAIDHATTLAGHTLVISSGTFEENVIVNKSLTLEGANADVPCGSRGVESLLNTFAGTPLTVTANNVSINGLEITGDASASGVICGNTSDLTLKFNNIHNIGNSVLGTTVFGINYTLGSTSHDNVSIVDNCVTDIASASLTGNSAGGIIIAQSIATGVLTNVNIERNIVDGVTVNNGPWPTGKIAYGIQVNVGGSGSYMTTTGKVVALNISQNEVSDISGHIATAIGLEGNTENASVTNNLVSNLTGTKNSGSRAGGGFDLSGIKFENNRYVSTVTVENNSFQTNTFVHAAEPNIGYAVSNYVPEVNGGILDLDCNWFGTAVANEIEDNPTFTGKIFNKDNCTTDFDPYLSTGSDGPGTGFQPTGSCNGSPVTIVIDSNTPQRCYSGPGALTATTSGGVSPYDYIWSNGATTEDITGLMAGTYTVTVTDDLGSTATASATVLYYPVENEQTGNGYTSIQSAINDVLTLNGHTIHICAGTYNENVTVNKEITLNGSGPANTILTPSVACFSTGINITAANVTIQNLKVTNYSNGLVVSAANGIISNVESVNNCNTGLDLGNGTTNLMVTNSKLNNNTVSGFRKGTAATVSGLTIQNTEVKGNIQGCFVGKVNGAGGTLDNVTITDSDFSNNTQKGMYFEALSNAMLDGIIMNNSGTDGAYGFNNGIDINLKYASYSNITIQNSEFTNCGVTGIATDPENPAAITIKARDDAPSYNGNPATLTNVLFKNNVVTGPRNAIRIGEFGKINAGPTNVTIEGNNLEGPYAHKTVINRTNSDVNLVCNWHGTMDMVTIFGTLVEAGTGSNLTNTVLSSGADGDMATGFQPSASCVCPSGNLVTNSRTALTYCSIQAAIDDSNTLDGDELIVSAGTYIENVSVTKEVSILGPNATVDACTGMRNAEAVILPSVSDIDESTSEYTLFEILASNVTISGLTLDGDNPAITTGYSSTTSADIDVAEGVSRYGTGNNLVVNNNIIRNLSYFGITMYDYPAGVPSAGNVISGNHFEDFGTYDPGSNIDYWGGGILLYNNQYAHIFGNCMENVRIGIQTGNFYQANPGASVYQIIENNDIEARRRGIFHNLAYSNASPLTLDANSITGSDHVSETVWDGILVASMSVNSTFIDNLINGSGVTKPCEGIEVWNVKNTSPAIISGGMVSNVNTGIFLNNFEGYNSNGGDGAHATVSNVNVSASNVGVRLLDSPSSTTHGTVNASVSNCTISSVEGIKIEENLSGSVSASFSNNDVTASSVGVNVTGVQLSPSNLLILDNNNVTLTSQITGGNPTIGLLLTNISGTQDATVTNNDVTGSFYGYVGYNINTTPVTEISGGVVSGVMQGVAIVNTLGGPLAGSAAEIDGVTMNSFTGSSPNPANNFQSGVYTFTAGGTTLATGLNLVIENTIIDGTGVPSQASGGVYLADFSGGGSNVQNISLINSSITNNANRGVDARGKVNLTMSGNTLTNNGNNAFGAGGNYGFSVIAQQNATITANNNFITLPSVSTSEVFALITGNGSSNQISATENSILLNGNADVDSRLAQSLPGTGSIDAECNWWGTGNYQIIQSLTNGNVDFINWLINGTDNDGMTSGFQAVPGSCTGEPMVINFDVNTPATCYTGNNGALDISISGGTPSYTYIWSNGANTQDITMLIPGSYSVTVTDSFGSTSTASATVGLLPVENVNTQTGYNTIADAVSAASPGDVIEVCSGTYIETLLIDKNLTINGPNQGIAGNGVRGPEAVLQDGTITVSGANTVVLDGFHVYQTNTTTPVSLGGSTLVTIQNNIIERFGVTAGAPIRGIEISAGGGVKNIENNLFTGDLTGGVFSGHKSWNSAMYVNGAGSSMNIVNNIFENSRTAINLDDYNAGIILSGNTFDNNGTHLSFGGVAPTTGSYTFGANDFKAPQSAIINLSNVTTAFRLDISAGTWTGTSFGALPNVTLFQIEAGMFHRGRSGRNGLVTYKTNNQYVIALNPSLQAANDYAPVGGIVNIDAATFNQKLQITKSLTVQGGTNDKTMHILDGTGVPLNTRGIEILTGITDVTIQNLTIQNFAGTSGNSDGGIYAVGPNNNNLTVHNVLIQNNGAGSGFYANGPVDNVTVTNCMVNNHGAGARGIVIWNGMKTNINISNNMLSNNNCCGIELQDGAASGVNVSYNTIDIGGGDNAIGLTGLDNSIGLNTVNNNLISGGGRFGIEIKNPDGGVTVDGNTVTLTVQNGDLRDRGGIVVMRRGVLNPPNIVNANVPDGVMVTNNTVSDYRQTNGGSSSQGFGIVVEGTNHTVTNNTLVNNDVAIQLQAGHTPYAAPPVSVDGDQSNLADLYFGRGNSPDLCNVIHAPNTFTGNTVNAVRIVTGGGAGTIQTDVTPTVNDPSDQTLCVDMSTAAVSFSGNYMVGVTYEWVNDNPAIGLAASGSGDIASFTALNTTNADLVANITVTPSANGCSGPSQIFTITVQPRPSISNQVTSPDGYNQIMLSGQNYTHTICHGEELTTSVPTLTSSLSTSCGTLRIQTQYISTLPNIPSATLDETYTNIVLAGAQTISPENHTLAEQTITFLTTPYYDVNGNMMFDAGTDVAGAVTQFVLSVQPKPDMSNTVSSGVYNQVITSGGSYSHSVCHNTNVSISAPTLNSALADACGVLRVQTVITSTVPNISSGTADEAFVNVMTQAYMPENNTGITQTITFVYTPYYDVNGNMMFEPAIDIEGEVTTFVLTVYPIPTGSISGTAFVIQNAPTTANVTFTGGVGTPPYTFTYNVNGGSTQTISTIGMNNAVTYPHPNGTPGVFTYTLLTVTDANGCEGVVDPMNNIAVITVIDSDELPDLSPSIARPLNASFTNGQTKEGYVQFTNGGDGPTYGVTTVRLPKTVGNFSLNIDQGATMSAGQSVQNNACTFVELLTVWEITYPDPIPLGSNIKIGFSLTATGSTGSNGTMTTTILNGSGGDSNNFNNRATRRFVIN